MATLILMGKSGSGKDTIASLLKKNGFKDIVPYTTRPKRVGEEEGVQYHFLTQDEFEKLREDNFFIESRNYNALFGYCSYGTSYESLSTEGDNLLITTPEAYSNILTKISDRNSPYIEGLHLIPVYLDVDERTLKERLYNRANKETDEELKDKLMREIDRRIGTDREDFKMLDGRREVYEINAEDTPENIANKIITYYNGLTKDTKEIERD